MSVPRRILTKYCNELKCGLFRRSPQLLVSLSAAKHRFESLASPLGKLVVWLPAFIQCAREIILMRIRGPEVDVARDFLEQINTETALMLSLMADGADDGLELTRLHDDLGQNGCCFAVEGCALLPAENHRALLRRTCLSES